MPHSLCLVLLMALFLGGAWYFGRLLWVGFREGRLIDMSPPFGVPRSRWSKTFGFRASMAIGLVSLPMFVGAALWAAGDLLGFWESAL
jgi:hypothetical protein